MLLRHIRQRALLRFAMYGWNWR